MSIFLRKHGTKLLLESSLVHQPLLCFALAVLSLVVLLNRIFVCRKAIDLVAYKRRKFMLKLFRSEVL